MRSPGARRAAPGTVRYAALPFCIGVPSMKLMVCALLTAALVVNVAPAAETPAQSGAATKSTSATNAGSSAESGSGKDLYVVKDGNKVDAKTLAGWRTWRALACERCHGAEQEGLVGPSLKESMKVLTKEEFHQIMMKGRPEKGMPPFNTSKMVMENWEGLYAYLKGRSNGDIEPGRLTALDGGK